jgi:hypothetical protein
VRQNATVRVAELQLTVVQPLDTVALFVDRAVVPPTEHRQVRERGRPAVRPVADVMALAEPHTTAREATGAVSVVECPAQRRRDRPRPGADVQQTPVWVVAHHHPTRIAGQALRRFRGDSPAVLQD